MKKYTGLLLSLFFSVNGLKAQTEIELIKTNWYNKKYSSAIQLIDAYYKNNKPNLKLDLIKVSSMCMSGTTSPDPKHCFDYISNAYKIPTTVTSIIQKAKNNCNTLDLEAVSQYVRTATSDPPRTVGKTGRSTIQAEQERIGDSTKIIKSIPSEDLQKRRLKVTTGQDPVRFFKKLYDSIGVRYSSLKVFGNFIIVNSNLALSGNSFPDIEAKLTTYYNFYLKEYGMEAADEYITVFLARDINELKHFSEKLHGFVPPSYTLGYSNLEDQTIVSIAFVPNKPLLGTACHELFHILSKTTYETLPAWLEEGMASLYEVSESNGSQIKGLNNWRIEFLLDNNRRINRKLRDFELKEILSKDWNEFNKSDEDQDSKQSFHYAYSRYLMLYLQEKKVLSQFFKEAANYSYMDIKNGPVEDFAAMIGKHTGDLQNFDRNFKTWIETKPLVAH